MKVWDFIEYLLNKNDNYTINRKIFKYLARIVIFFGIMAALNILFPRAVAIVLNIVWILLLLAVIIFIALGILVVLGLRREAQRILEILLEGSLSFLEFWEFLKLLYRRFVEILKEFLLYAAPIFAYVLTLLIYVLLIVIYKTLGKTYDVTLFTIVLTVVLMVVVGVLSRPKQKPKDLTVWKNKFGDAFKHGFVDGFEVMLFIFFLTMDNSNLFFLPENLNIPLRAQWGNYDLMRKSFVLDAHLKTTINLIMLSIVVDIFRNCMRLVAMARLHYSRDIPLLETELKYRKVDRIKIAIRKAFGDAKDDLVRFITFTTVLFAVFMLFPRLKLLALAVSSLTALVLDLIMRDRLVMTKGNDLISRLLAKVFKV